MTKRTIARTVLTLAGLALSLYLALSGIGFETKYGIRTLGTRVAEAHAESMRPWEGLETLKEQVLIDWVFWFALMFTICLLVTRLWNWKRSKRSEIAS